MIRVVLVDDHDIVRQGIKLLLEEQPDILVVGDTHDGMKGMDLVEQHKPDVLVTDMKLSGIMGLEVTRQVRQRFPNTRVVVLSMYANAVHVVEALRSGACAYVVKDAGINELVKAVRAASAGQVYLSPELDLEEIEEYRRQTETETTSPYDSLTKREREVLIMVAQGFTSSQIAEMWVVSRRTVETQRASMMHKLNLESQADLVRFALRRGLLPAED